MRRPLVTGIGIVSPLGADRESTWASVRDGKSGATFLRGINLDGLMARIGAQVPRDWLDPGDSDRDPVIRFALKASAEAIADAGLSLDGEDRSRVACFVGSSKGGVVTFQQEMERMRRGEPFSERLFHDFLPNMSSLAVAERYDLTGPCGNIVAACATGALCIARAAELIQEDVCDVALAGASDASITPAIIAGFDRMGLLAHGNGDPAAACRPFDASRSGFVLGEGACVVVVEEAEHAGRRRAKTYGRISGWCSSSHAFAMTHLDPEARGIADALSTAITRAGIGPHDIGYINAHGTGTQQNDIVETKAIRRAFGKWADAIPVSSTKPMTGHLLGAAGSIEFALALLAMRDGFAPPTINLNRPDPECDLDYVANKGRKANIRHCASISSGLGAHICVLVASSLDTDDEIHF